MDVKNKKWSDQYFFKQREEVLSMWPTGKDVDLDEAVAYLKQLPDSKNSALKCLEAREKQITYLWPSLGTDTVKAHKELLLYMQKEGEVDFLVSYIDSLTRNCKFEAARQELNKAETTGKAVLNGFPIVVHGVKGNREMIEAVDLPVIFMGPTPDARLTHEIGLAGGHTGYSGGPMISFWNYTKDVPLATIIHHAQYTHRLMGYYEEKGVPLLYCVSGAMPSISPPSLLIVPEIIEILIAAEQGVRHFRLNAWLQGNLSQDIAYIRSFKKLTHEYLARFNYTDYETTTFSTNPTGRYPKEQDKVFALISYFTMLGLLAGVQGIGSRSIDEALYIPTKEGSATSFRCAKMMVNMQQPQEFSLLENDTIKEESEIIEKEVNLILEKVIEMGDGDIVLGTIKAVEQGILDQPFATSNLVKGQVMGVKDHQGAARFFDFGSLPFDQEIKNFHIEKIAQREKILGKKADYSTIIKDLTAMGDGGLLPS